MMQGKKELFQARRVAETSRPSAKASSSQLLWFGGAFCVYKPLTVFALIILLICSVKQKKRRFELIFVRLGDLPDNNKQQTSILDAARSGGRTSHPCRS
jgi:hypothetical protein